MAANTNCLEGVRCPQCGYQDHFFISGTSLFSVYDDGTDSHEDVEWDDASYIRCASCRHEGTLRVFRFELRKEEESDV